MIAATVPDWALTLNLALWIIVLASMLADRRR